MFSDAIEVKFREKEQRYNKIREKYSQSMRPQSMVKVSEAQNEFEQYNRERQKIQSSHSRDIPELIRILPLTLNNARDVATVAEQNHRLKTQNCMKNISQIASGSISSGKYQVHEEQQKILAKLRKLKICQNN